MLVFTDLPTEAPMERGTGFPDHVDPRRIHWLPRGVRLLQAADGMRRFTLARWRDVTSGAAGGMLHVELGTDPPEAVLKAASDGWVLQPITFQAARMRLEGWAGMLSAMAPLGPWRPGNPTAEVLAAETHALTPEATQVLDAVLARGAGSLGVTVEAEYAGLGVSLPVLVTARPEALRQALVPLLPDAAGDAGAQEEEIRAAVLSLPEGGQLLGLQPLAETTPPSRDSVLAALTPRLLGDLLLPVPGATDPWAPRRYRWAEDAAAMELRSWDLSVRLQERARWQATWSASDFLDTLSAEERTHYFPSLPPLAPFAPVPVVVLAALPVDARFLRSLQVDVTTTGATGLPQRRSFIFPAASSTARFTAFYPALTRAFSLSATVTATLAAAPGAVPAWPVVLPQHTLVVPGTLVEVTAEAAGIGVAALSAESAAFERAAAFEAVIRRGTVVLAAATLTQAEPVAAPAFALDATGAELPTLTITARQEATPGAATCLVHNGPAAGAVAIRASMLEVLAPDPVTVSLDPACTADVAFAAITLCDLSGRTRSFTLDPGASVVWPCWRVSVFAPVAFRFQLQHVARRPDGTTAPLTAGPWLDAQGTRLVVAPATEPAEVPA